MSNSAKNGADASASRPSADEETSLHEDRVSGPDGVDAKAKEMAASMCSAAAFVEAGMQDAEEDSCSICLDDFASDPPTITVCNHQYHLQCILEWSQRSKDCPMCWREIALKDPDSQELLEACAAEREARAQAEAAAAAMAQQRHLSARHVLAFEELANLHHRLAGLSEDGELEHRLMQHLAAAAAAAGFPSRSAASGHGGRHPRHSGRLQLLGQAQAGRERGGGSRSYRHRVEEQEHDEEGEEEDEEEEDEEDEEEEEEEVGGQGRHRSGDGDAGQPADSSALAFLSAFARSSNVLSLGAEAGGAGSGRGRHRDSRREGGGPRRDGSHPREGVPFVGPPHSQSHAHRAAPGASTQTGAAPPFFARLPAPASRSSALPTPLASSRAHASPSASAPSASSAPVSRAASTPAGALPPGSRSRIVDIPQAAAFATAAGSAAAGRNNSLGPPPGSSPPLSSSPLAAGASAAHASGASGWTAFLSPRGGSPAPSLPLSRHHSTPSGHAVLGATAGAAVRLGPAPPAAPAAPSSASSGPVSALASIAAALGSDTPGSVGSWLFGSFSRPLGSSAAPQASGAAPPAAPLPLLRPSDDGLPHAPAGPGEQQDGGAQGGLLLKGAGGASAASAETGHTLREKLTSLEGGEVAEASGKGSSMVGASSSSTGSASKDLTNVAEGVTRAASRSTACSSVVPADS